MKHSEKERLAAQLTNPMRTVLLTGAGDIVRGYGNGRVVGNTNTIVALMDRGLIQIRGAVHYWTALGREVARLAFGSGTVRSLDELHAEALTDARQLHYRARSCCSSTHGDVHNRACGTIEARKQWAPAGSAHGPVDRREQPVQISQIERWLKRHGVEQITAKNVLLARAVDHAEAIGADAAREMALENEAIRAGARSRVAERYAIRPQPALRATTITQAEYGRAYDALMSATGTDVALRAALAALGMTVRQS